MSEDRRRILDLLTEGTITPEQAENLLRALGESPVSPALAPVPPAAAAPPLRQARSLQIKVHRERKSGKVSDVNITVPLGLVKFASRFMPKDAVLEMQEEGIDFSELISQLASGEGLEPGVLVDVTANEDDESPAHILIRAV